MTATSWSDEFLLADGWTDDGMLGVTEGATDCATEGARAGSGLERERSGCRRRGSPQDEF